MARAISCSPPPRGRPTAWRLPRPWASPRAISAPRCSTTIQCARSTASSSSRCARGSAERIRASRASRRPVPALGRGPLDPAPGEPRRALGRPGSRASLRGRVRRGAMDRPAARGVPRRRPSGPSGLRGDGARPRAPAHRLRPLGAARARGSRARGDARDVHRAGAGRYELSVRADSMQSAVVELVLGEGERLVQRVDLVPLAAPAHVRGELRSRSGRFEGAVNLVAFSPIDQQQRTVLADWIELDGQFVAPFEFTGFAPGEVRIKLIEADGLPIAGLHRPGPCTPRSRAWCSSATTSRRRADCCCAPSMRWTARASRVRVQVTVEGDRQVAPRRPRPIEPSGSPPTSTCAGSVTGPGLRARGRRCANARH